MKNLRTPLLMDNEDFLTISKAEENLTCQQCGTESSTNFIPEKAMYVCKKCGNDFTKPEFHNIPIKNVSIFKLSEAQFMLLIKNYLQTDKTEENQQNSINSQTLNLSEEEQFRETNQNQNFNDEGMKIKLNTQQHVDSNTKSINKSSVHFEQNLGLPDNFNLIPPEYDFHDEDLIKHLEEEDNCPLPSIESDVFSSAEEFLQLLDKFQTSNSPYFQFGDVAIDSMFDPSKVDIDSSAKAYTIAVPESFKEQSLTYDQIFASIDPADSIELLSQDLPINQSVIEPDFDIDFIEHYSPVILPSGVDLSVMDAYLDLII